MYRNTYAAMSADALIVRERECVILVRPEFSARVTAESFDPLCWGKHAVPVDTGGRGAAWFLNGEKLSWLLRCYQRGGLVALFNKETHWYHGQKAVRSFAEFHLLNRLYSLGLPVPQPVATCYYRVAGFWYRAKIIVTRIPGAVPFSAYLLSNESSLWASVGQLIRRFHDRGVYHADLNCHNILISGPSLYLVDFDKSGIRRGSRWKYRNLQRLRRSINKVLDNSAPDETERRWQELVRGYETFEDPICH